MTVDRAPRSQTRCTTTVSYILCVGVCEGCVPAFTCLDAEKGKQRGLLASWLCSCPCLPIRLSLFFWTLFSFLSCEGRGVSFKSDLARELWMIWGKHWSILFITAPPPSCKSDLQLLKFPLFYSFIVNKRDQKSKNVVKNFSDNYIFFSNFCHLN